MYFENVKKNFGFGMMRLPMIGDKVDEEQVCKMVDLFLEEGFNYFDTAHLYIDGKSEQAVKNCLSSRHSRDKYILTNKLTSPCWEKPEDIRPLFQEQLDACGVEYFDYFLMHALNKKTFDKYKEHGAFEIAFQLKEEGKIKHVGLSFHDKADVLDEILTTYPQVEVVQIQYNYLDLDDDNIQSQACYEVCRKHNKPIIVMEPVKGGTLANLPAIAKAEFDKIGNNSPASYAIRYAAGKEGMFMTLSGMSNLEQMKDNISFMKDFQQLDDKEMNTIDLVTSILKKQETIACTACRYCTDGCPMSILIPDLFGLYNAKKVFGDDNQTEYDEYTSSNGKASECITCGQCEQACPQKLKVIELLEKVTAEYE